MVTDHQGSVIAVNDQTTGLEVAAYRYDATSNREVLAESVRQLWGYTGREVDGENSLYHYRARAYDPAIGRYIQEDPLFFAARDLNTYNHVWSDPVNWTDLSGLSPVGGATRSAVWARMSPRTLR